MPERALGVPTSILLATDLGARCDRALDRAVQLSAQWGSKLTVLHVIEPRIAREFPAANIDRLRFRARSLIASDLAEEQAVPVHIEIRCGATGQEIAAYADEIDADLIVTGTSKTDWLGQTSAGSTVSALARGILRPLLIVKKRGRAAYQQVLAATDLSEDSLATVGAGANWFPRARSVMFHSYQLPLGTFAEDREEYSESLGEAATTELRRALNKTFGSDGNSFGIFVAPGDPALRISKKAELEPIDLVITGTAGRTGVARFLLGSVAQSILDTVPADVLIMPERTNHATHA